MVAMLEGRVAVHVGRRPWKDTAYLDRLNEAGLSAERVKHLCSLPQVSPATANQALEEAGLSAERVKHLCSLPQSLTTRVEQRKNVRL
ncbi:hypothetical protein T484DRAFT_1820117 [Baffinella frigidus]|nr:hypothetical protein T484DRAFT_1820117 [Cryptophyta sp. CCMP2293]